MKQKIQSIMESSFYQLLLIYFILVLMITFSLFYKYTIHMEVFALILGILGFFIIGKNIEEKTSRFLENKNFHYSLVVLALLLIFFLRAIPYMNNNIPLGYDAGIYKYAIEHGLENLDNWILQGVEPGFLYLMSVFRLFLSTDFTLRWLFILFNVLLGFSIYLVAREYFNKTAGILALFIYTFSIIQFKVFEMMYYKNVIGLSLALLALYFLKKHETRKKYSLLFFVICAVLTAWIHRPTFYIFGLSYFFYSFASPYKDRKYQWKMLANNILIGIIILALASLLYFGKFSKAILLLIEPIFSGFVEPGQSSGTFINFFTYQFTTLVYLPLGIIGLLYLTKKKQFNALFFWALISAVIVYFQFFFFNRFIIFLDIVIVILASAGFSVILEKSRKIGILIFIILFISLIFSSFSYSFGSKPLLNENELDTISQIFTISENEAFAMSTSAYYSTWVQGYSQRRTIAPGLFDYDIHNEQEWKDFWASNQPNLIKNFLEDYINKYKQPLYIFIGERQKDNLMSVNITCLQQVYNKNGNKIYKYQC
ncbi:EpsG family protein [Candidatus Pacearchaeota archaeon]|nr:EpsG family protein [Candidatus Pacearchaeota archaeon]